MGYSPGLVKRSDPTVFLVVLPFYIYRDRSFVCVGVEVEQPTDFD